MKFTKNEVDAAEFSRTSDQGFGKPKTEYIEYKFENGGPQHKGITQNFTDHLIKGTPLLASGYEGINGLSISNAMMLSSWKNDWVNLPNDGEEFWGRASEEDSIGQEPRKEGSRRKDRGSFGYIYLKVK